MMRSHLIPTILACALVTGCYDPQAVRQAPVVYSGATARPPRDAAACVANRHLLATDKPLEAAYDERDGSARVTAVMRDTYAMNGGIWYWELTLIPLAGGGAQGILRSNRSIWEPFAGPEVVAIVEGCMRGAA